MLRNDFRKKNLEEWKDTINKIFPNGIPERAEWSNIEDIIKVLNVIGTESINHMFYPTGGGLDLTGVDKSHEYDCIKLYNGSTYDVVKPEKLIFNSFKKDTLGEWSYFRLENYSLNPSGVYEYVEDSEELVCINNSIYIDRGYWDQGFYYDKGVEKRFTTNDTVVTRILKGSFVIFAKSSIYNDCSSFMSDTYDARHNKMNDHEFREYIEDIVNKVCK